MIAKEIAVKKYAVKLSTEERERLDTLIPKKRRAEWHKAAELIAMHAMKAWHAAGVTQFGISARSPLVLFTQTFLKLAGNYQQAGTIAGMFDRGMISHWVDSLSRQHTAT